MKPERLTQETLKSLLSYNDETGDFFHIPRAPESFGNHGAYLTWTKMFSGKKAGATTCHGYITIRVAGGRYFAHRLAWLYVYGCWPSKFIDHINHDRTDNRISNLRDVETYANAQNRATNKANKSGKMGVTYIRSRKQRQVSIRHKGERIHLGWFRSKDDAISARTKAEREIGYHPNHGNGYGQP